ncbi:MAG: hypothetical protein KAR20_18990, partial [Candidatus Heimdallarchaeota archaeon]|nr:hypothetical protein [Candidatus Heimdallarchaeota archaeon]
MSFKTLYHPHFEPNEVWLRSMLLFYDTIHTIVPDNANYSPSKAVSLILEKDDPAIVPISPNENDLQYDWAHYKALYKVLSELANEKERFLNQKAKFSFKDQVPMLDFQGLTKVHYDKMADMLRLDLLDLGLATKSPEENWLIVDVRVADLILSMLADNIKNNRSSLNTTASDQENSFAVAKCCEIDDNHFKENAILATSIIASQIPDSIQIL